MIRTAVALASAEASRSWLAAPEATPTAIAATAPSVETILADNPRHYAEPGRGLSGTWCCAGTRADVVCGRCRRNEHVREPLSEPGVVRTHGLPCLRTGS